MSEPATVETHYCEWPVRSQYYTPREMFGKTTYRACARGVYGPRGHGMVLCWQHSEAFVNEMLHRIESDSLNARELELLCSALVAAWEAALARNGGTQAALANKAGVSRAALSRKMRGDVSFTVDELVAVAIALDVDASTLPAPALAANETAAA